jgi:tetratricopeptide (TPR) repeat protein
VDARSLSLIGMLLVEACRGGAGGDAVANAAAAVTARTWGLAYLQSNQLPQAEAEFRKVVALAPDQAVGYADLGLVYLREARYREAEAQLRRAAALDSADRNIGLMLAKVYELSGREAEARREVERVLRRDSTDIRALYAAGELAGRSADPEERRRQEGYLRLVVARAPANLAARLELVDLLLARGAADDAAAQLEALQRELPQLPPEAVRFFQRALRSARAGRASEAAAAAQRFHHAMEVTAAYQASLQRLGGRSDPLVGYPVLTFNQNMAVPTQDARAVAAEIRFTDVTAGSGLEGVEALPDSLVKGGSLERVALAASDYDDDESEDLFVSGHLFRGALGRFIETTASAGIVLRDRPTAAAFGDYDNDGRLDLYVATSRRGGGGGGGALFRSTGGGRFRDIAASAGVAEGAPAAKALFVDFDHDGDLDLLLATPAGTRAYRNNLDGTFRELAAQMGISGGGSRDVAFGDFDGDGHTDLVIVGDDGHLRLWRNLSQGRFEDATAASGLGGVSRAGVVAVGDYDNDGFLDLFVTSLDGLGESALYHNRGDGTFEPDARAGELRRKLRGVAGLDAAFFDFDNDGLLDLIVVGKPAASPAGGRGVLLFRNDPTRGFEDYSSILPDSLRAGRAVAVADVDQDGDLDLVVVGWDGRPRLLRNDGGNVNQYVKVRLVGLRQGSGKNNAFGLGATLELRAGDLYQLRQVTDRVTHFGLGRRLKADVLRVRWPNGVSQTVYYPGTEEDVLEQQILKGSCPFLYAWDGHGFSFVTDVMWRSALGMPLGIMAGGTDIAAAPPHASREYMRVPGAALVPRDGRYVLQITDELWETGYLDQVKLLVVDHPDSEDVYVNEGFVPPAPGPAALRLYSVSRPRLPVAATDEQGTDWLPALRARDDRYVAPLTLTRYQGIATLHDLILDFGDLSGLDSVHLFLAGWIFPTDASINLALAQRGQAGVIFPYVEVKDPQGRWRRVADVGFPSGKSKTVVVDLTGKFLSADHRVRLRTNMEIYWDQAFVAGGARSAVTITALDPAAADVHYRGFSRLSRKGGRYGPEWPAYGDVSRESPWEPIVGAYTRYGDVLPLVRAPDDMYIIIAPGDEATLTFDANAAPPLAPGWTRDFLLYTDAWLKDSDRNTAAGNTVTPLPFHGMSRYPYGADEAYPKDAAHQGYLEQYNTRRVTRYRR